MFFERSAIKAILEPIVLDAHASRSSESDLFRNTLDCFSCVIDASVRNISISQWLEIERGRQIQKTLQNKIGDMHQKIIGTLEGIEDLHVGSVLDLISHNFKFVAEVKNKHNTTKGNHKIAIYDDIENYLANHPEDYIGYYVEILPMNGKRYNIPFIPSDNKTRVRRPINQRIRKIDGYTFYDLVTGEENSLHRLYNMFPELIQEIIKENIVTRTQQTPLGDKDIQSIFKKIFL